ncbi:MAG TPA: YdcF family protein [Candidatus Saccharimonadia bacterium]|jgi:uncharacterized SAM-binding protein YcdF (DUF218 family)|nr:YdcF family protein [Candidatus Saccharimonadia bacterium]
MRKLLVGVGITLGVLVLLATGIFFGIGYYLSPQDKLTKADAIVAISGGETQARTEEAIRLYKEGYGANIIFSGAALDTSGPSNAKAMAQDALAAGVPQTAIQLDEAATNTRENASGVSGIVHEDKYHSIILVTSPYHQRRAYITFHRALGSEVKIINHSSYDAEWRRSHWWATPASRTLTADELQKVLYELLSGKSK